MPPLVALAIGPYSPPLKPLEQVLRDRHAHVYVLSGEDPFGTLDRALPDIVIITSCDGAPLARAIRERHGPRGPRLIGVFPEYDDGAFADTFDEGLPEAICSRTLARIIEQGCVKAPSTREPGSPAAAAR